MKKILLLLAVICLGTATVFAQDAKTIVDRYNQVTGLDKLSAIAQTSLMMDVVTKVQGMTMPMKVIASLPGKFRVEMDMGGVKMLMVTNGEKGWMSVPGQGTQPMPQEILEQLKAQTDVSRNYKWDADTYEFETAGEVKEGGKTLQAVRFTLKKPVENIKNLVVYFDTVTGLADYMTMDVEEKGQAMSVRTNVGDYKTFGTVKIPSVYTVLNNGAEMMKMEIKALEYNYPTEAWMFAKPE